MAIIDAGTGDQGGNAGGGEGAAAAGNGGAAGAPAGGNGNGAGDLGFLGTLPEDLRADPSLQNFKDAAGLAKSYVETKKMIGDPAVLKAPTDPAKREEWKKATLPKLRELGLVEGAPEKPELYDIKIEGVKPEDIKSDPGMKAFFASAHKLGVTNGQAQGLLDAFAKEILPGLLPPMAEQASTEEALSKEWGDKYGAKLASAKAGAKQIIEKVPGFKDLLEDKNFGWLGNHPAFVRAMALVGESLAQDSSGSHVQPTNSADLAAVEAEINAVRNDKANPWFAGYAKGEPKAVEYVSALYQKASKLKGETIVSE